LTNNDVSSGCGDCEVGEVLERVSLGAVGVTQVSAPFLAVEGSVMLNKMAIEYERGGRKVGRRAKKKRRMMNEDDE
jgi:hypothetical protein